MKNQISTLLLILMLCFTVGTHAQTFQLQIDGGIGSGTYNEGDTIHVWTKSIYGDTVFTRWTGSGVQYLSNGDEWHTTLVVPSATGVGQLNLKAHFDILSASTRSSTSSLLLYGVDDGKVLRVEKEIHYSIPKEPKGLVFLLHGTQGNGAEFYTTYEKNIIVKDFVYAGFAVVTLDANEVTLGDQSGDGKLRWVAGNAGVASIKNNIDLKNISMLKDSMIELFGLGADIPCFSFGVSNGAVFSDICASALGFVASAHMTANGNAATYLRSDAAPVIWIMSINDHNENADAEAAMKNFETLRKKQVSEWHWFRRSPAYHARFRRSLNGVSAAQSRLIFDRLRADGWLGVDSFFTTLEVDTIPLRFLVQMGLSRAQIFDVFKQFRNLNADHGTNSDFDKNIIRFFNAQLDSLNEVEQTSSLTDSFRIFPNPAFDSRCRILMEDFRGKSYELRDIYGHKIQSAVLHNSTTLIDLSGWPTGIYFLTIYDENNHVRGTKTLGLQALDR